jgi:hypothetical protein
VKRHTRIEPGADTGVEHVVRHERTTHDVRAAGLPAGTALAVRVDPRHVLFALARAGRVALTLARFAQSKHCRLMSSDVRSVFSEAFWKKQERKGRAGCGDNEVGRSGGGGGTYYSVPLIDALDACRRGQLSAAACERIRALDAPYGGWKCGQWELNYPPPASLDRISGRRRRRRT